nr:MAG TPA: hypothetical protein [Bacteriophage sp.]
MRRQKHIVNPEKKLGTIKKNTGYTGYMLFTYAKGAATDVVIVSDYNTDFIRYISLDYSTLQVYEQKRYLQAWDK